jgi:hypothetical protein
MPRGTHGQQRGHCARSTKAATLDRPCRMYRRITTTATEITTIAAAAP